MDPNEQEEKKIYKVVVNGEEQYSIWPADRPNAAGYRNRVVFPMWEPPLCGDQSGRKGPSHIEARLSGRFPRP
jgi:hypothetical protein